MADPSLYDLFTAAYRRRDTQASDELERRIPALTEARDKRGLAHALLGVATRHSAHGDISAARKLVDRALLVVADDDLDIRLELLNTDALLLLEEGRPEEALEPLLLVTQIAGGDHPRPAARARINVAFCLLELDDLEGAKHWAEQAYERRSDGLHDAAHALWVLTEVASQLEDADGLALYFQRLVTLQPSGEGPRLERRLAARSYALAKIELARENFDEALAHVASARSAFASTALVEERALCDAVVVDVHLQRNDLDAARATVDKALEAHGVTGRPYLRLKKLSAVVARRQRDFERSSLEFEAVAAAKAITRRRAGRMMRRLTEKHLAAIEHVREFEVSTLNTMLQRTLVELEESRAQLHSRVVERTQDLEESLASLKKEVVARTVAEQAALSANQAKTLFLANMSHELRTPLTAIQGYAELLQEDLAEEYQQDIHRVLTATMSLLQLIDELLDLVRIEAGELRVDLQACDTTALLAEAADVGRVLCGRRGLTFITHLHRTPLVVADRGRAQQVLQNLLSNASKFTPNGTVELRTRILGSHLLIEVQDTGIGLDASDIQRIFRPFEQVDPSYSRNAEGTGLGLAIARHLMEAMSGDLTVHSVPNEGSTFTMRLPLV